ncbi:MAG: hypothetical protein ABIT37_14645 [Luteolibacter sp.]
MPCLPLIVTVGFSGSRRWFDTSLHPTVDPADFSSRVGDWLAEKLRQLPKDLGLTDHHHLCGLSQIAIGADMAFTRACRELDLPQWIFLPQHRDAYLDAASSKGVPDFTSREKQEALELLKSPHIIHELTVGEAHDRQSRFEETNIELVRKSDVLICIVSEGTLGKPGGTGDVVKRAANWHKPLLLVTIGVEDGRPLITAEWQWNQPHGSGKTFAPSELPPGLAEIELSEKTPGTIPSVESCLVAVQRETSKRAKDHSALFKTAALVIVGTHFLATVFAVTVLILNPHEVKNYAIYWLPAALLLIELGFLGWGFITHQRLHKEAAASQWAFQRLAAEVARSVRAFGKNHLIPAHLNALPFPPSLNQFLRTIGILHLRDTRAGDPGDWKHRRDTYVETRLKGTDGQIHFYHREARKAAHLQHWAHRAFMTGSLLAIAATALKLVIVVILATDHHLIHQLPYHEVKSVLGFLAVVLPVVAVAALSLAAANDLEARHHTFAEMHDFLKSQTIRIGKCGSEREFSRLLLETESRLLGETLNWFSRRSFTAVA